MSERIMFQINLTPAQRDTLRRIAERTGRSRANVIKGLIALADGDPVVSAKLGSVPPVNVGEK